MLETLVADNSIVTPGFKVFPSPDISAISGGDKIPRDFSAPAPA